MTEPEKAQRKRKLPSWISNPIETAAVEHVQTLLRGLEMSPIDESILVARQLVNELELLPPGRLLDLEA
jgi:hypothetical protein